VAQPRELATGLEWLAVAAAEQSEDEEAMRLAGVAARLREEVGMGLFHVFSKRRSTVELDRALVCVRQRLGPAASEDLWERGRRMPLDRAIGDLVNKTATDRGEV
jgi:hypothetical protein